MLENMERISERMEERGIPPERVAQAIERALTAAHPRARYLVGADARVRLFVSRLPDGWRDRIVAAAVGSPKKPSKLPREVAVTANTVR
jgi:hypothetical protein